MYDKYVSLKVFNAVYKYLMTVYGNSYMFYNYMNLAYADQMRKLLSFKDNVYKMIFDKLIDVKKEIENKVMNVNDSEISKKFNDLINQTENLIIQIDEEYDSLHFKNKTYVTDPKTGNKLRRSDTDICLSVMYK